MADEVSSQENSKDTSTKGGLDAVYEAKPIPIKVSGKSVNVPVPAGNILIGGGTNEGILAEMQKLIEEREAQKKGFGNTLADAMAWWSGGVEGPGAALAKRRAERQGEDTDIFNLKMGLAQQKMALDQAKNIANIANQPPIEGGVSQGSTVTDTGSQAPSNISGAGVSAPTTQYKSQLDADIATLPPNQQLEARMLKAMGPSGIKEIYKRINEYNIKGRPNEAKVGEWLQSLPENTQEQRDYKAAMYRQHLEKGMGPSSKWVNNQEVKSSPNYTFMERLQPGAAISRPAAAPSAPAITAPSSQAVSPPAAVPSAPAATKPTAKVDASGLPAVENAGAPSIGGGTVQSTEFAYQQFTKQNDLLREKTLAPMLDRQDKSATLVPEINKAINVLDNTKVGPGTGVQKLLIETKGVFTDLPKQELRYLSNLRTLDSVGKKIILSDAKGSLPGSFSDSDRQYVDQAGSSINDPKDFIKATLELKKAAIIANNDLVNYLNKPENAANIAVAMDKYKKSGRGMAILRQNAPTLFAHEKKETPSAAAPKIDRDAQARDWLKNNPDHPDASAVRKKLEGKQ